MHSHYHHDGYIDSTAYYDIFFNTLPTGIQSRSQKLSYIDSADITIHFQSPSGIVITRVYCIKLYITETATCFFGTNSTVGNQENGSNQTYFGFFYISGIKVNFSSHLPEC